MKMININFVCESCEEDMPLKGSIIWGDVHLCSECADDPCCAGCPDNEREFGSFFCQQCQDKGWSVDEIGNIVEP